jgi:hypothetical protein
MVLRELPDLLETLDRGELTHKQQQRLGRMCGHSNNEHSSTLSLFERRFRKSPWQQEPEWRGNRLQGTHGRVWRNVHWDGVPEDLDLETDFYGDDFWPWAAGAEELDYEKAMLTGDNDTLLVRAARRGRTESIEFLLELGASLIAESGCGETPLFAACLEGHVAAVRILLDFIPRPDAPRSVAQVPLRALKSTFTSGHTVTDYTVLSAACTSISTEPERATPALHQAQHSVVKCLLEEYYVPIHEHVHESEVFGNYQHAFYQLITSFRVNEPQKLATIELFLKHGADPNQFVWDQRDQTMRSYPQLTIFHELCCCVNDAARNGPQRPLQKIFGYFRVSMCACVHVRV